MSQSLSKNDLLNTSRSQRHSNHDCFVKSRVAPGTVGVLSRKLFFRPFTRKCIPRGAFLKIPTIENGTQINLFIKVQHLDPLKTVPVSGFETTWKNNEKTFRESIVFYGPKPLENIEKQTLLLVLGHSKNNLKIF